MEIKDSTGLLIRIAVVSIAILGLVFWGISSYDMNTKEGFLILAGGAIGAFLSVMMHDIIRYGEETQKK